MHDLGELPSKWARYVHVDGKPYYHHSGWGVVTEACVYDAAILGKLETWYHQVRSARSTKKPELESSKDFELYLTLDPKPAYYFVDHDNRSVFWLDPLPLDQLGIHPNAPAINFGNEA